MTNALSRMRSDAWHKFHKRIFEAMLNNGGNHISQYDLERIAESALDHPSDQRFRSYVNSMVRSQVIEYDIDEPSIIIGRVPPVELSDQWEKHQKETKKK